jgi:hypothetical protein
VNKKYYNTKSVRPVKVKAKYVEDIKIELSSDCKKLYRIDLMKGDVGVIDCYYTQLSNLL